ncbi:MAG: PhzF family phenazine biosynthesis protein [Nitrospinae bacterium]|nr:PhzF family phenazine biosynthesis protein [Nitrospinota bacterium]MBL7021164.1 PhzF family phenazine biosynthesis protein [Nitrospinaceae bacterium]
MEIPFYQVDVFTDHIFGGNPLAVFTSGENFEEEELQKVAREMNLSETTFVYPSSTDEADFDVRIFTPTREIPFAGHPTLGTAYVLRKYGAVTANPLRLNFKAGIISVWTEGDKSFMQHPPAQTLHELNRSEKIAEALGLPFTSLDEKFPIQVVSTGFPALFVPVSSLSNINEIHINTQVLNEVLQPLGIDMVYPFCRETRDPDNTVHVRAFAPGLGIPEDPATGSVAGAMGAYWASLSDEEEISMVIEQGYAMQRPSLIYVEVLEAQKIRVGGQCQSVFTGCMNLEKKN